MVPIYQETPAEARAGGDLRYIEEPKDSYTTRRSRLRRLRQYEEPEDSDATRNRLEINLSGLLRPAA